MTSVVMITGAGTGMGRELVQRSLARGDTTIATVLTEAEAGSLGKQEKNLHVRIMDVSCTDSVIQAFSDLDAILGDQPLDRVIHCAGISPSGAVEVEDIEVLMRTLNVNAVGTARVLQAALPRLRGHKGRIVLFSSLWGKVAGPMLSAYCASKHAIEAIVDSARRETLGQDVDIVLIEPGVVRTHMVDQTVSGSRSGADALPEKHRSLYGDLYTKFANMIERESTGGVSVERAADIIEKASSDRKPKTRYRIGADSKAVITLASILPDRVLDRVFRTMLDRK